MGIRIFNIELDDLGSGLCAITAIMLIAMAMVLLIEFGEYLVSQFLSFF